MRIVFLGNVLLLASETVTCMPYILLNNKAPKCYNIDARSNTKMIVTYHAPGDDDRTHIRCFARVTVCEDMVIIPDKDPEAKIEGEVRKSEEGIDTRFNERFQKRMDTLKRAHLKDINFSITPRDASGVLIAQRMMAEETDSVNIPVKKREQLESIEGFFEYDTGALEGSLEICIQSYTATAESPSRVAFSVLPQSENAEIEIQLQAERTLMNANIEAENKLVKEETSRISAELIRMQRRAKAVAGDAQFSKQREETFHKQSINLNRAVRFWPMVRVVVLLIGGYIQVTHVVNFMKSRHIY